MYLHGAVKKGCSVGDILFFNIWMFFKGKYSADCAKTVLKKWIILERIIIGIFQNELFLPFFRNKRT
jgi:hypothetical protein